MLYKFIVFLGLLLSNTLYINSQNLNAAQIENLKNEFYQIRRDLDPIEGIWTMSSFNTEYNFEGTVENTKFCNEIAIIVIIKNENNSDGYNVEYFNSKEDFTMQYLDDFIDAEGKNSILRKIGY